MALLRLLLIVLAASASGRHTSHSRHKHQNLEDIHTDRPEADRVTIIDLPDILATIGQGITKLASLQCIIPAHLKFIDIDPDFSHMLLPVNISLGNLEIIGDYSMTHPLAGLQYTYGNIYLKFHNVSVTGTAAIALTPAALFSLRVDLNYNTSIASARVVPFIQNAFITEQEILLSLAILENPLMQTIKKELTMHLDYLILLQINTALGRMNVFTVGQHKIGKNLKGFPDETSQKVSIEELVDVLLENVRSRVPDEIDIPNFNKNFSEKLESTYINGTFRAESGWLAGMSTLKRVSNVSISKETRVLELSVNIGFDVLEMGYDNFIVKLLKRELSGELKGKFLYRMMSVTLRLDANETEKDCKVQLKELQSFKTNGYKLETMADISKDFDWLKRRINIWLIGHFHSNVAKLLQKEIGNAIKGFLHQLDCGEYIHHFKPNN